MLGWGWGDLGVGLGDDYRFLCCGWVSCGFSYCALPLFCPNAGAPVACMTRQPTCTGCPLLQTCPYSQLFETPAPVRDTQQRRDFSQIPHAYVVEPPPLGTRTLPAGAMLEFHIVLFGKALQQLALVVFALQRGLASRIPHAANNCICNKPCKRNLFGMKPSVKATSPSHTCHSTRGRFCMGWN